MAGPLANSVALLSNPEWKKWMTAAAAYQARVVYTEAANVNEHAARLRLALDVLTVPDLISDRLATLLAADGSLVAQGSSPDSFPEAEILTRVANLWTPIAKTTYPAETS